MYFSVLTTYSYSFGGSEIFFHMHCLVECDSAGKSMTAPVGRGERETKNEFCRITRLTPISLTILLVFAKT